MCAKHIALILHDAVTRWVMSMSPCPSASRGRAHDKAALSGQQSTKALSAA
jgi:hypothetical protein